MKYSRIFFVMVFILSILSCQQKDHNQKTSTPNNSINPNKIPIKSNKSSPEINIKKTIKKSKDNKSKKRDLSALDTLKPISTAP